MRLLNEGLQKQIKEVLNMMTKEVTLVLFTKEGTCDSCEETKMLLTEISELSTKVNLVNKDFEKDLEERNKYGIEMVPAFVILDEKLNDRGVKFNGIPAGHEINSFISALIELGGNEVTYDEVVMDQIRSIDKPINIKVFSTMSCPHCPGAVQTAHRLAMINPLIKAEMVEANTFSDLSIKYNVSGVPKIIINETHEILGNQPVESFLQTILKV